ncbi:MAG: trimethylamine methyltransferase family protein [Clostridiales Family XIII bacterium]|jgi:trimethylamine--corrinoid protein Co-methyltransferase|nr:trimethylamine methyltransferase family protein [Clostridiales Family XIII bacterium]
MKGIKFQIFEESECEMIVETAKRVLEQTGCEVLHEGARDILAKAGCVVCGARVRIPAAVVENALKTVPDEIDIYSRDGEKAMTLKARGGESYFGAGVMSATRYDYKAKENHPTGRRDAFETGLVIDALPNIDVATGLAFLSDVDVSVSDIHEVRQVIEATSKPILILSFDLEGTKAQIELLAAAVGGMDRLREKPCVIAGASSSPPLKHSFEAMDRLIYMFEAGVPTPYMCSPMVGMSAPTTLAGACVMGLCDCFAGMVISQAIRPGCPFMGALLMDCLEMRQMKFAMTSPEFTLGSAASGDLFRYLNIPSVTHFGCTDSPVFDQQAAADITMQIYSALLCKTSFSFFLGYLESANSSSLEALVFADEVIDMLRHVTKGIEVNKETLAEETINQVGSDGNFMGEDHTLAHFRENWSSIDFIHEDYTAWTAAGGKDYYARASEKVEQIISRGVRHPLTEEKLKSLDDIIADAERRRGLA